MKMYLKTIIVLTIILLLGGCKDFNKLVVNPNLPTSAPAGTILTGVLNSMNDDNAWDGFFGSMVANQFWISTYTYYGTNNYDQEPFFNNNTGFDYYFTLKNITQMEKEAAKAGAAAINPYTAMGKFLRAYYFNLMSQKFGDIPMSQALGGKEIPRPVYDTQKEVYINILRLLEESNDEFAQLIAKNELVLTGDIYLNNNLAAWQKAVNSFKLRVLISLSKKENDTDLNIKSKFADVINNPGKYPVFTTLDDNVQYKFNAQFNNYSKNPGNIGRTASRENIASTILEITTAVNDPRTYAIATPAPALVGTTTGQYVYTAQAAYVGGSAGESMSNLGTNSQNGFYSYVNPNRYYGSFDGSTNEPAIIIGYPELCFNIAEGINRGWASGSASEYYMNGIKASLGQFKIKDGTSFVISDYKGTSVYGNVVVSATDFLAQSALQYKGNNADGLKQIIEQKYVAFWQNSNWEAYFNFRRTGTPSFKTGSGTGNNQTIPMRFTYPQSEISANPTNYANAIQRQFGGTDDLNGVLWINQP